MNEFRYKLLPTAEKIHTDPRELIAVVGAWGSGKSTIAATDLYQHCIASNINVTPWSFGTRILR